MLQRAAHRADCLAHGVGHAAPAGKHLIVPVLHARQRIQARGMEDEVAVAAQHAQPAAVAAARAIVLPLPKAASPRLALL